MKIRVLRLPNGADLPLPAYATAGAAGLDLRAAAAAHPEARRTRPCANRPRHRPAGRLRSAGAAPLRPCVKHGITVLNAPGTIDADYRGEIQVPLINHGQDDFVIARRASASPRWSLRGWNRLSWWKLMRSTARRGVLAGLVQAGGRNASVRRRDGTLRPPPRAAGGGWTRPDKAEGRHPCW